MAQPIFKLFKMSYTPAWYALSIEEQHALTAKIEASRKAVGAEVLQWWPRWMKSGADGGGEISQHRSRCPACHDALYDEVVHLRYQRNHVGH